MSFSQLFMSMLIVAAGVNPAFSQNRFRISADLENKTIQVGDLKREYLIYVPENQTEPAPLVFGFHGHGGSSRNAARSFHLEKEWPEAIVVYMQGIPTPGMLTDPEGKRNGWQHGAKAEGDRDLKFFDAVLKEVKKSSKVDESRIYSTGHSNGGGFTYLLWAERGDVFAAIAPSAATAWKIWRSLTPKPVMHLAGEKDTLVKFRRQQLMMQVLRRLNQCEVDGEKWSEFGTRYPSPLGTPVVTYIHPGTHKYPAAGPELIVKFFKEHSLRVPQIDRDSE